MSNSTNQHQDPAKNDAPRDPVSPSDEVMDDDEDEEFEDVLPTGSSKINGTQEIPTETALWTPTLSLPPQRTEPIAPGSEEENQLRGRVSEGIDRINYLEMRARMSMDTPETPANERGYGSFAHLCRDVEALVDLLWASATPCLQAESLISLAGITEEALREHPFEAQPTLTILHKFDKIFEALCTGVDPVTKAPLREAQTGRTLVTQTQKVRIRSLAESTRTKVFSCLARMDESESDEDAGQSWLLAATKIYESTLMLLADQGDVGDAGTFVCPG